LYLPLLSAKTSDYQNALVRETLEHIQVEKQEFLDLPYFYPLPFRSVEISKRKTASGNEFVYFFHGQAE
jgi:hypothetical protein